jgi:hypothetical protein
MEGCSLNLAKSIFSGGLGQHRLSLLSLCLATALFMNVSYSIEENVSQRLGELAGLVEDRTELNDVLGRQMANDLREHFRERNINGPRNQFGAPSSGIWGEIRDSVSDQEVDATGATVTISDPRFPQKYYGGTIHMEDKMLAIPARAEAYDKSPRLFSNLKAIFFRPGLSALVMVDPGTKRKKGEKRIGSQKRDENWGNQLEELGFVFYWLKQSVTQQPDYDALPPADRLVSSLLEATDSFVARILKKQK